LVQDLLFGFNISPNRQFDGKIFIFSRRFEGCSFDFHEKTFVEKLYQTCVTFEPPLLQFRQIALLKKNISASAENFKSQKKSKNYQF